MSDEILFIAHRIPFPPDRGDKIRSHHILKALAAIAPVHVACFADDDLDMAEEAELAFVAKSYRIARRSKPLMIAGAQAVYGGLPVSLPAFFHPELADYVRSKIAEGNIATIFVFSGQMGQYVPSDYAGRLVVDFVDVDSAKFETYAQSANGPMRWVYGREAKLLQRWEGTLASRADVSTLVSQDEANLFRTRLEQKASRAADVRVLTNGIDTRFFDPASVEAEARLNKFSRGRLIFTGQMDYAPNIAAVERMARRIMPLIHETLPDTTFHIVGRNPSHEVMALHGINGCHVWGRVDDVRPWLKGCDLAVVPLEIARGIQNKVLEAMAMQLPVVLTRDAATGIDAVDSLHFQIANKDDALAAAAINLLSNTRKHRTMGRSARTFVMEHMSWTSALEALPGLAGIWKSRTF